MPNPSNAASGMGFKNLYNQLALLQSEAKRVKPDALLTTSSPDPHYTDVTSIIRLNDMTGSTDKYDWEKRAYAVAMANPGMLIDGDGWHMWDSYAEPHQFCAAVYGVNSQYHVAGYDQGGSITVEKGTLLGKLYRLAARKTPGNVNMVAMGHFTNTDLTTGQ